MSSPATNTTSLSNKDTLLCAIGSPTTKLTETELREHLIKFVQHVGPRDDILLIPPDHTRIHSQAGTITRLLYDLYHPRQTQNEPIAEETPAKKRKTAETPDMTILPALGTHAPMTRLEIQNMFGNDLAQKYEELFLVHDWRNDVVTVGQVSADMVSKATHGQVTHQTWPAQVNKHVWNKRHEVTKQNTNQKYPSLIVSIGQVVPHEVLGMANYNKNLLVGCGGKDGINWSHFIGAVYGMEQILGQADNPLRDILQQASVEFLEPQLDLWYILTVVSPDTTTGDLCVRGLYIGKDIQCYQAACDLSLQVNFTLLEKPVETMVVYLDPSEFHSTWLGNKAIYRTRMALADGGTLYVLAPGVEKFGEDGIVDGLIRKYGYRGTPVTLQAMKDHQELRENLSAVAHLIHGSSEGRFRIVYCPGHLSKDEIEGVGFDYGVWDEIQTKYDVNKLQTGWHTDGAGDEFYFIRNPALGLWAIPSRFESSKSAMSPTQQAAT